MATFLSGATRLTPTFVILRPILFFTKRVSSVDASSLTTYQSVPLLLNPYALIPYRSTM
jgi:hypothetical protein